MTSKTLHNTLEKLDGYLISIKRNVETSMYELEVGFRKNWVFKSTDDIECEVIVKKDSGTLVTIHGKHSEVIIDDLIDFVNKVIDTNKKITEMQDKFEKELEEQKESIANQILKFEESIAEFKDSSFDNQEDESKPQTKQKKPKKAKEAKEEVFIDDDVVNKIS